MASYKGLWFSNMLFLGFKPTAIQEHHKISVQEDMFNCINKKGSEIVLHFLLSKLAPELAKKRFRTCWPVYDKRQEQEFRKTCVSWIGNIAKEIPSTKLPRLCASLLLSPGGNKYYVFVFNLSRHVLLEKVLSKCSLVFVSSFLSRETFFSHHKTVVLVAIKSHTVYNQREVVKRLALHTKLHQEWVAAASEMVMKYQKLCKVVSGLRKELSSVKGTTFSELGEAARRVQAISTKVNHHQRPNRVDEVCELWGCVESYEEASQREREVVGDVLVGMANQHTVDARHFNIHVPDILMGDYEQLVNSGSMTSLYQNGRVNLLGLLKLYNVALRSYKDTLGIGVACKSHNQCCNGLEQQKALLVTIHQMRTQLDVLSCSLTSSINSRVANLDNKGPALNTCIFSSGQPPLLGMPSVSLPSLGLLPLSLESKCHSSNQLELMDQSKHRPTEGRPQLEKRTLSTPEAVHKISLSVQEAVAEATIHTADSIHTFEPTNVIRPRLKGQVKPEKTVAKATCLQALATATPPMGTGDTTSHTPKLSVCAHKPLAARNVVSHSTAYDELADQIVEAVSGQSEKQMLMEHSPVTSEDQLHLLTNTEAALDLSAFVSKDRIARTPLKQHRKSKVISLTTPIGGGSPPAPVEDLLTLSSLQQSTLTPNTLPATPQHTTNATSSLIDVMGDSRLEDWIVSIEPPTPCPADVTFDSSSSEELTTSSENVVI